MYRRQTIALLLLIFASLPWAHAQYEVPDEIFRRTLLIRSGKEQATALKFDQGGQIYLVTTRHFGTKLQRKNAIVQVWHAGGWSDLPTVRTLFPASNDVDLAILETSDRTATPYAVVKSEEVLSTEQKVWVMGWPGPLLFPKMPKAAPPPFKEIPLVAIGTIAAIDPTHPDSFEIHTRVFNTDRTGGGPIIYWSSVHRDFEILGVIKRTHPEALKGSADEKPNQKTVVVKGYSIDLVVEAISNNPRS